MTFFPSHTLRRIDSRLRVAVRSLAFVVCAILASILVACSAPPDRVALATLQTLKVSADSYMRAVATQYAFGRQYDFTTKKWSVVDPSAVVISEDVKAKSIAAYDKFSASAKAAAFALKAITMPAQGDAIVLEVQESLNALLALLRAFGVRGV